MTTLQHIHNELERLQGLMAGQYYRYFDADAPDNVCELLADVDDGMISLLDSIGQVIEWTDNSDIRLP